MFAAGDVRSTDGVCEDEVRDSEHRVSDWTSLASLGIMKDWVRYTYNILFSLFFFTEDIVVVHSAC